MQQKGAQNGRAEDDSRSDCAELPPDLRRDLNQVIEKIHIYRNSKGLSDLQSDQTQATYQILKKIIGLTMVFLESPKVNIPALLP